MTEKNYAYYNTTTGLIDNVIWVSPEVVMLGSLVERTVELLDEDGNPFTQIESIRMPLVFPEGYAIVEIPEPAPGGEWSTCGVGWSYLGGKFIEPPMPEPEPQPVAQGAQTL